MPIYEFYCPPCHTVYSFLSRKMQIPVAVTCPKCGHRKLEKKVSRFAISKGLVEGSAGDDGPDPFANIDESKMEQLMSELAPSMESEGGDEDPRQIANLMKRMFQLTGAEPTGAMLEAMKRMEAGEDPDSIDEDIGEAIDSQNDPFSPTPKKGRLRRLLQPPDVDPELYEIE